DGIRYFHVTGVQTCALPIFGASITMTGLMAMRPMLRYGYDVRLTSGVIAASGCLGILIPPSIMLILMASYSPLSVGELFAGALRSEERRVGMECRSCWQAYE